MSKPDIHTHYCIRIRYYIHKDKLGKQELVSEELYIRDSPI